jgi:signal transduction histidine kinase
LDKALENAVQEISEIDAVPTILEVVCRTTGMGFAAVARVTENRWIACGVRDEIDFGLVPGGELKIETTICNEIRQHREAVVIDNVDADPVFAGHHTPAIYGLRAYISMPIVLGDGSFFGTLCAIDRQPRKLNTPETIGMFKLFAELIAFHLDAHRKVRKSEEGLRTEQRESELREQFIAVLGHDLRNPLAAISAGARRLSRSPMDEPSRAVLDLVQKSVSRMSNIIDDVLDLARSRLGSGIGSNVIEGAEIKPSLDQVVAELQSAYPDRVIDADIDDIALTCDPGRIAQLLSNLIANALTHGASDGPVTVRGQRLGNGFEISVTNAGDPIPSHALKSLFEPFVRSASSTDQKGLGLGLYIASEIAKAHGGKLNVISNADRTTFSLSLPCT